MHAVRTPLGVVFTPRAEVAALVRATFALAQVADASIPYPWARTLAARERVHPRARLGERA